MMPLHIYALLRQQIISIRFFAMETVGVCTFSLRILCARLEAEIPVSARKTKERVMYCEG